jgi:hypothetical protein
VPTYFRGWDRIVRRQLTSLALWGVFPLAAVAGAVLATAVGSDRVLFLPIGLWAVSAIVFYFRHLSCPCPRCRRSYATRSLLVGRAFSGDCANCGLVRFTPYPGARPPGSLLAYWRFRRRFSKGCCGYCGYDLRQITDRCPECGEPAVTGSA